MARMTPRFILTRGGTAREGTRRGVSIVESAFMLPIMASLIFGAIEFGSILHMRHTMMHAAREAARSLAVQGGSVGQAVTVAETLLPTSEDLEFEICATQPSPDDLLRDVEVEISLPLKQASLGDMFGLFGEDTMDVRVTMRSEQ